MTGKPALVALAGMAAVIALLVALVIYDVGDRVSQIQPGPSRPAQSQQLEGRATPTARPHLSQEQVAAAGTRATVLVQQAGTGSRLTAPSAIPGTEGSGVHVGSDHILTAAHVVGGCGAVTISYNGNQIGPATIVALSRSKDLALLHIAGLDAIAGESLPWASSAPAVGAPVTVVGYPVGVGLTASAGIVSGLRRAGDSDLIQTDASMNPGNSGGPVLDDAGELAGIADFNYPDYPGLNFAVAASTAQAFVASGSSDGRFASRTVAVGQQLLLRTILVDESSGNVYIADDSSESILVLDPQLSRVLARISVGQQGDMVLGPPGRILVTSYANSGTLLSINTGTDAVVVRYQLPGLPAGIAFNPNTNKLYVAVEPGVTFGAQPGSFGVNGLLIFDATRIQLISRLNVKSSGVIVDPSANVAYFRDSDRNVIVQLSGARDSVIGTLPSPIDAYDFAGMSLGPTPHTILLKRDGPDGFIAVVDSNSGAVISRLPVPSVGGDWLGEPSGTVFVESGDLFGPQNLEQIDLSSGKVVGSACLPAGALLAWNAHTRTLYAADGRGSISIIDVPR